MSTPVNLSLDSTLVDSANGRAMARMYLPDDDIGNRWALDKITWEPSDQSLADLPFPIVPDTDAIDLPLAPENVPAAYFAQAVLAGIPEEINPAGDGQGFIGGSLSAASLKINQGKVSIELGIARRIPAVYPNSDPPMFETYADVLEDFPTLTYADVSPNLSYYDARLARHQSGVVIPFQAGAWKWLQIGRTDTTHYEGTSFDDSGWATAAAPFGQSTPDGYIEARTGWPNEATLWNQNTRMWLRRTIPAVAGQEIAFTIRLNRAFVAYLNGVAVANDTAYRLLPKTYTVAGSHVLASNVLAIQVTDDPEHGPSTGCYFDVEISQ